jgi:hypothetical protein
MDAPSYMCKVPHTLTSRPITTLKITKASKFNSSVSFIFYLKGKLQTIPITKLGRRDGSIINLGKD